MTTERLNRGSLDGAVMPPEQPKREERKWWAVVDGRVTDVIGYRCDHPNYWWCPKVGYSMSEKVHLFETEGEALIKAIAEAEAEAVDLQKRLSALKTRRHNDASERRAGENLDKHGLI